MNTDENEEQFHGFSGNEKRSRLSGHSSRYSVLIFHDSTAQYVPVTWMTFRTQLERERERDHDHFYWRNFLSEGFLFSQLSRK